MIARYNFKWEMPVAKATPIKIDFELKEKIIPISFNEDKSVKEYTKEDVFIEKKSKWSEYIKSFDVGSPSEQVIRHIKTGEPLITAHTLPHGDYTSQSLLKGAEIVAQMKANGITLDMIESVLKSSQKEDNPVVEKPIESEGDK